MGHERFNAAERQSGLKNRVIPNREQGCRSDSKESRLTAARIDLQ